MRVPDPTARPPGGVLAQSETHLHSRRSLWLFFSFPPFSSFLSFRLSFGGFRGKQLLNGHGSSETRHWEAQRGYSIRGPVGACAPTHTCNGKCATNTWCVPGQVKPGSTLTVRGRSEKNKGMRPDVMLRRRTFANLFVKFMLRNSTGAFYYLFILPGVS